MVDITKAEAFEVRTERQTELAEPIHINWTGRLRDRIRERLGDYCSWVEADDGTWVLAEDHGDEARAAVAVRTLRRQQTNVVIRTVDEAVALHNELDWYCNGAGPEGITWMNGSMQSSARRVSRLIREGLEERGYTVEFSETFRGKIYVPDVV